MSGEICTPGRLRSRHRSNLMALVIVGFVTGIATVLLLSIHPMS